MNISIQQTACCDFVTSSTESLFVDSGPGSGKTTTIGLMAKCLKPGGLYLALCFNRSTAEQFQTKLPYYVQSSTCHKAGKSALDASFSKRPKVTADKCRFLLKDELIPDWSERREIESPILRLTSLLKQQVGVLALDEVEELADRHDIEPETRVLETSVKLLALSDADTSRIDFDDMLRFTLLPTVHFTPCHVIFLDEAQDTNAVQRAMLRKMLAAGGRLIAVGDRHQSIYGFRGADANAIDVLVEEFSMKTLRLSVSYRCSRAVIAEANQIFQ